MFTLEQVKAEATRLNIELSDDQAQACVTLNRLPTKDDFPSSGEKKGGGNNEDDHIDFDNLGNQSDAVRNRINKLNDKHSTETKALRKTIDDLNKRIQKFEDNDKERERKEKEAQGKHSEVADLALKEKEEIQNKLNVQKEKFKEKSKLGAVKDALRDAGCVTEKFPKALQLIDLDGVDFTWKDEDNYDYTVDGAQAAVSKFKETWPEFFNGKGSEDNPGAGDHHNPQPPRAKKKGETEDEKLARVRKKVPALSRLLP